MLPYFEQFSTAEQVLAKRHNFDLGRVAEATEQNSNLILFCELHLHQNKKAINILAEKIDKEKAADNGGGLSELQLLKDNIKAKNWIQVDNVLNKRQTVVLKKLKL